MNLKTYLFNLVRLLNRIGNTLLGGHPEVAMSARAGYWQAEGIREWPARLINFLFRDEGHCSGAYSRERDPVAGPSVADPEGRYLIPLLVFWITVIVSIFQRLSV